MNCLHCKKEYTRSSNSQKYCSKECQSIAFNTQAKRSLWQLNHYDKMASVASPDKIQCVLCKRYYVQIGSHVHLRHGMTAREYKQLIDVDVKRGLIPEHYREIKKDAFWNSPTLGNLKKGKKYWFKKGSKIAGRYHRSKQTMDRLKNK